MISFVYEETAFIKSVLMLISEITVLKIFDNKFSNSHW